MSGSMKDRPIQKKPDPVGDPFQAMNTAYYDRNAETYFKETVGIDMSRVYERFTENLPPDAHILDAGCGFGRDSRAFLAMGYRVTAFDLSGEMVIRARRFTGIDVQKRSFGQVDEVAVYDGIWTCASLLHVPQDELPVVMSRLAGSLKAGGIWYASFKSGSGERTKDGRLFTDLNESDLARIVASIEWLSVESAWSTTGGRPGQQTLWLNALLRKSVGATV